MAQFAKKICLEHGKELTSYCKSCKTAICSSCVKAMHINHDWESIVDLLKEKRLQLPLECRKIRSNELDALKSRLEEYESIIEEIDRRSDRTEEALNKVEENLIMEIKRAVDERKVASRTLYRDHKTKCEMNRDKLKKNIEVLETMTTALDEDARTLPDDDILEMEEEMTTALDMAKSLGAETDSHTAIFVQGEIDSDAIKDMIGYTDYFSVKEVKSFRLFNNPVCALQATSKDKAWIREERSVCGMLVNHSGEELKRISTRYTDLTVTCDRNIVYTKKPRNLVTVVNESLVEIKSIDTKPLQPTYISSRDNHILITLVDGGDMYTLLPDSRRIVQRWTLVGDVVQTYEYRENGKTRLFTRPTRTAENKNTDICVVNMLGESNGELLVLRKDGRVKFTFRGEKSSPEQFLPYDVACDSECRILISEPAEKSIYILNSYGKHVGVICKDERRAPAVLTLYDDTLWVGMNDGTLKLYQYKHQR